MASSFLASPARTGALAARPLDVLESALEVENLVVVLVSAVEGAVSCASADPYAVAPIAVAIEKVLVPFPHFAAVSSAGTVDIPPDACALGVRAAHHSIALEDPGRVAAAATAVP